MSLVPADDGGLGGDYDEEGHASRHAHNGADVGLKGVNKTVTLTIDAKSRCDLYPAEVPHEGGDAGARVDHHHDLGGGQGGAGRALYSHLQPRVLRDVAHI